MEGSASQPDTSQSPVTKGPNIPPPENLMVAAEQPSAAVESSPQMNGLPKIEHDIATAGESAPTKIEGANIEPEINGGLITKQAKSSDEEKASDTEMMGEEIPEKQREETQEEQQENKEEKQEEKENEKEEEKQEEKRPRETDENETEDQPEAKRRKAATPESTEVETSQSLRRSGRERKSIQREGFVSSPRESGAEELGEEETPVVSGRGIRLDSIPDFVSNYNAIKNSNPCIRKLYKALFNNVGKAQTRRVEILRWSGIPDDGTIEDLSSSLASSCTLAELSEIGKKFFGLSTGAGGRATKPGWCEAIADILANPQADKIQLSSAAAVPESARGTGGARRAPSGYQLFCSENRESLKAKHADTPHRQFLKVLSEAWKNISDEDRQKYLNASNAMKVGSPAASRKGGKDKRRGKKNASSDDDEPDFEAEEDEEEEEPAEDQQSVDQQVSEDAEMTAH